MASSFPQNQNSLNLPPRVAISLTSGNNTLFGKGDAMFPLWENNNQFLFGDIVGKYGDDDAWLMSAGLGTRKVLNDNLILGSYFFGDFDKTPDANHFTIFNPGIEFMTNQWDGHLNGYLPIGQRSKSMGTSPGSELGIDSIYFSGHAEYDTLYQKIEEVGPGADFEVGRTFASLKHARIFAGAYYFDPEKTSKINGGEAGVEMPLNYKWATVEVRDSYDNLYHNTVALTVRITFGGLDKTGTTEDIHNRLLDIIPRHIADLQTGDGIPSRKETIQTNDTTLLEDNIWFFNADGTPTTVSGFQSCTFEHPCIGLEQTQIDSINALSPNANFYFSSGTYNNPSVGSGFNFYNGQSISGRTSDFTQLATGDDRPLLNDSVILNGNNNIYNIVVNGHSIQYLETGGAMLPFQVGVLTSPTSIGNVNIYNSNITSNSDTNNTIALANNSDMDILNVYNTNMISSAMTVPGSISIGAGNLETGEMNIYNSYIMASNIDTANNGSLVFSFVNNEDGKVNISNTSINASLTHGNFVAGVLNNSTDSIGTGTINITNSTITVTSNDANLTGGIFNQANNINNISSDVNIDQSTISVTSINNGGGQAAGILASGDGTVSINHSTINGSADSGTLTGILVGDPAATLNFQNTVISLNTSNTAIGFLTQNAGTLNDNGGNRCFANGVAVPC